MKLTFRTVTNKVFKLDLEESTKVYFLEESLNAAFHWEAMYFMSAHVALIVDGDPPEAG